MPWKNLQTVVFDPAICPSSSFNANVEDARLYGAETDLKYQASAFLSMGFSASYNDSTLTTKQYNTPSFPVVPGERLPYVPYLDVSGNARYERPLNDRVKGYVQYDIAHKGDMWNDIANTSNGLPRVFGARVPTGRASGVRAAAASKLRWSEERPTIGGGHGARQRRTMPPRRYPIIEG